MISTPRLGVRAILAALPTLIHRQEEDMTYRNYVSDALRLITENTARYAAGNYLTQRFCDLIRPNLGITQNGEEIAADVIKKCGLKVVG